MAIKVRNRTNSRFRRAGTLVHGLFFIFLLAGCAAQQTSSETPMNAAPGQPTVYYSGVEGLKLYSEPRFSTSVLAELPLHQKVYRYKVERGFANVKVDGTDRVGWVNNAQLIWRLPSAPSAGAKPDLATGAEKEKPQVPSETPASSGSKPKPRSVFEPY